MRILFVSNETNWGGAACALYNIVSEMSKKGHFCAVFLPSGEGRLVDLLKKDGILCYTSVRYGDTVLPKSRNYLKYIKNYIERYYKLKRAQNDFVKAMCSFNPDIVHNNVGPLDISPDICTKRNIPHVWHIREYQDLDFSMTFMPSKEAFIKKIHRRGTYNIAITKGIYEYWHLRDGVDTCIYDGVFHKNTQCNIIFKKDKYILFCGRIEAAKDPLSIIKIWPKFLEIHPDYQLLLAGNILEGSKYVEKCKSLVQKQQIEKTVKFLGLRSDVYDLMKHASALVVPSRFEGFGLITAEAMLNGCPVIGRNSAGTKEQFDKGLNEHGSEIAFRFSTEEELLHCLCLAVEDKNQSMILNAQNTVLSNYTIERNADLIEKFYNKIIVDGHNQRTS